MDKLTNDMYKVIFEQNAPTKHDLKLFNDLGATNERVFASCFKSILEQGNDNLNPLAVAKWLITMSATAFTISKDDYYTIMNILSDGAYKLNGYVD